MAFATETVSADASLVTHPLRTFGPLTLTYTCGPLGHGLSGIEAFVTLTPTQTGRVSEVITQQTTTSGTPTSVTNAFTVDSSGGNIVSGGASTGAVNVYASPVILTIGTGASAVGYELAVHLLVNGTGGGSCQIDGTITPATTTG